MNAVGSIEEFMRDVVLNYNAIRGKHKDKEKFAFWDAVVISASDEKQLKAYEIQVSEKQKRLELPLDVPFHIFADPPECKIGCGGSTMFVLEKLAKLYGHFFQDMRILFIPAGGYSQRLPSWSILGKLFCPTPLKVCPMFQMLDLILAVYLPFLAKMSPGVFLACSDAIISYCMEEKDNWTFCNKGFTALAHPSSISIGVNHGVYVLSNKQDSTSCSFMSNCIKVLQKPTERKMRDEGAVIKNIFPGIFEKDEIVYSDSVFFFDMQVALKLIDFYNSIKPLNVEISSYGDFLQPLGTSGNSYYIDENDKAYSIKMQLYELLHEVPLSVLVLKCSKFHHFGTMPEYLENYGFKSDFAKHFPCSKFVCSVFCEKRIVPNSVKGTIMHSCVHPDLKVPPSSIVEYCDFTIPLEVGINSVISNCKLHMPLNSCPLGLSIRLPDDHLIYTVAVTNGFVTVCFSITDDIKKSLPKVEAGNLTFLNNSLSLLMNKFKSHMWFDPTLQNVSLWDAKIFCVCQSMDESFVYAVKLINYVLGSASENFSQYEKGLHLSMKDIMMSKNVEIIIDYQKDVLKYIESQIYF